MLSTRYTWGGQGWHHERGLKEGARGGGETVLLGQGLQYPDQQKKVLQVQNLEEAIKAIKEQIPEIEKSPVS